MKQWMKMAVTMVVAVAFAGLAYAGMMTGEVTKYEAGKSITVKDDKGKEQSLEITKDTKIEGEVKAGAKVSVEADGMKAKHVKAAMAK